MVLPGKIVSGKPKTRTVAAHPSCSVCGVIAWGESHRCLDCPKHLSKQRTKSEFGLCAEFRRSVYCCGLDCCGLDADSSRDNTLRLFRSSRESFGFPRDVPSLCRSVFWVSQRRPFPLQICLLGFPETYSPSYLICTSFVSILVACLVPLTTLSALL